MSSRSLSHSSRSSRSSHSSKNFSAKQPARYSSGVIADVSRFDLENKGSRMTVFICSSPNRTNLSDYIAYMEENDITDIINFSNTESDAAYSKEDAEHTNVNFHFLEMSDGSHPSPEIMEVFDEIIDSLITDNDEPKIMMHCQAGLGRAPVMLGYLMISRFGYRSKSERLQVIEVIRDGRRNALNTRQLSWITTGKIRNRSTSCVIC